MKVTDMDEKYCLGIYNKENCLHCKRNIRLYEDDDVSLYWIESHKLRSSKAKTCPQYKAMDNVK